MNRLILIGNGFDLAHGLKSSFKDFIEDYLREVVNSFFINHSYSDDLIKINYANKYSSLTQDELGYDKMDIKNIFLNLENNHNFKVQFISKLLKNVYLSYSTLNWVDIEIEYFNILTLTKKGDQIDINNQFDFLKNRLIKYLNRQQSLFKVNNNKEILVKCFTEKILVNEIVTLTLKKSIIPSNLYFLNFNYTDNIEAYSKKCNIKIPSEVNYIHGSLNNLHGEPIFGFGDEFDKRYIEFEDQNDNELFRHIKSFEYLKTKNYYSLIRFIESGDFQVQIYGHSCGISDRTMLNQIFEHDNCKSIKIFYYKTDDKKTDFTEKTYEISRHFKNKGMLRKKLVPFVLSREMPQPLLSPS